MEFKNVVTTIKSIRNPLRFRKLILYKLISLIYKNNRGTYVLDEKWDNLIILDACRYDFFEKYYKKYNVDGILEKRISRGAHTTSFLTENFKDKYFEDIIYITSSPFVDILLKNNFFKIISVWKDGWNEEEHTVLPEIMYKYSLDIIKKYPNKKKIIHFMQPHYPYIGYNIEFNNLEELRESTLNNRSIVGKISENKGFKEKLFTLNSSYVYRIVDINTHIRGYWNNLKYTFPYVEKLLKILPGTTVITADHGEAFGEYVHPLLPIRYYGHRKGVKIPILVNVPWLIVKQGKKENVDKKSFLEREILLNKIKYLKGLRKF